jgi:tetratricopeptide (TPR) repeat protein
VDEALQHLPEQADLPGDLRRRLAESSLRKQEFDRALDLAQGVVSDQSKDYRDHLWMGHVRAAAGQTEEATAAFRRAVELAEQAPAAWVALVRHLAQAGQKPEAEAAIARARRRLPERDRAWALAQCQEAVGSLEAAKRRYQEVVDARPKDVDVLRGVASFYLRQSQFRQAEPHLWKMTSLESEAPEDAEWARNALAIGKAVGGNPGEAREAMELLGLTENGGPAPAAEASPETVRARALVLAAQRGLDSRRKAIPVLERLVVLPSAKPDDLFLLAQLYDAVGDWPKANRQMMALLAARGGNPLYVAHHARRLIRRGEHKEAEAWVKKLAAIPEAAGTFPVAELKARQDAARGDRAAAVGVVNAFVADRAARPADQTERLGLAAAFLDHLSQTFPDEPAFAGGARKLLGDYVARRPEKVLALVALLGRQGRTAEALDWCERAWPTRPAEEVANAAVTALHGAPAPAEHFRRVERWLAEARARDPKSVPLLVCLADLRDLQGRYAESVALYREALRQDGRNVEALNNLAWLLALQEGKGAEALALIERAITVAGPAPELLDTRAVIFLAMGRGARAMQDLQEAIAEKPLAASWFHLALVHSSAKDRRASQEALQKAIGLGLKVNSLHALERDAYQRLRDAAR